MEIGLWVFGVTDGRCAGPARSSKPGSDTDETRCLRSRYSYSYSRQMVGHDGIVFVRGGGKSDSVRWKHKSLALLNEVG